MEVLQRHCADRGVVLMDTGHGWSLRTAPDLAPQLREALTESRRLPRVAMETLVVIALHQPVTRADIEQIRGVSLGQAAMDVLLETGLIQPWGRKDAAGAPYGLGDHAAVFRNPLADLLRPGMSVEATIHTDDLPPAGPAS